MTKNVIYFCDGLQEPAKDSSPFLVFSFVLFATSPLESLLPKPFLKNTRHQYVSIKEGRVKICTDQMTMDISGKCCTHICTTMGGNNFWNILLSWMLQTFLSSIWQYNTATKWIKKEVDCDEKDQKSYCACAIITCSWILRGLLHTMLTTFGLCLTTFLPTLTFYTL